MRFRFPSSVRVLALVSQWLPLLPLLPLLLAFSLVLWTLQDTLITLHQRWTQWDQAYSHGYLLILVCLLFIFRDLRVKVQFARVYWPYSLLIVLPSLVWSFGYATQIALLQQMALPALLACLILPLIGLRQFWSLMFPLALLYLAIPLWEVFLPLLRSMTSHVATQGVRLLDVPAFIDGFSFVLPYGTVVIAGSCAGLSYFLMGLALASINSKYRHYSIRHTILSIGLMSFLAIFSNWFRVYSLILIAYYSQMNNPLVREHGDYGWWVFSAIFFLFLWLIRRFPEAPIAEVTKPVSASQSLLLKNSLVLLLTSGLALVIPIWLLTSDGKTIDVNQKPANPAISASRDWTAITPVAANSQFRPKYTGYDKAFYWQTQLAGRPWLVGQLVYQTQKQGKELISDSNSLASDHIRTVELERLGVNNKLAVYLVMAKTTRLVVTTQQIGKRLELGSIAGKVAQFSELLAGRQAVALWYASTVCSSSQCQTELVELHSHSATLQHWIEDTALY